MSKSDGVHDILGDIARGNLESLEALLEKAELKEKEAMGKVLRREKRSRDGDLGVERTYFYQISHSPLQYIRNAYCIYISPLFLVYSLTIFTSSLKQSSYVTLEPNAGGAGAWEGPSWRWNGDGEGAFCVSSSQSFMMMIVDMVFPKEVESASSQVARRVDHGNERKKRESFLQAYR